MDNENYLWPTNNTFLLSLLFMTFICLLAGDDYQQVDIIETFEPISGPLSIDCIRIPFIDDNIPEFDETLTIEIAETRCTEIDIPDATVLIESECVQFFIMQPH